MRKDAAIIALVALAHGTSHFFQLIVAPLFPFIKDSLGVSYAALGFVVAVLFTVSAVCQPVAGFVVDRYGPRAVLLAGTAMLALGALVAAASGTYAGLVLGAALVGLGNGVFHPADFALINGKVSVERLGYAFSAHGVFGYVGYAVAPVFSAAIGSVYGWQAALYAGAGVGLAMAALLAANARRLQLPAVPRATPQGGSALARDLRVIMAAPVVLCFLYFTVFAAGLAGLQSFGVAALTVQYGVATTLASTALTAYLGGAAGGILAGGFVATRTPRHDVVAMSGLAGGAALMLAVAAGAPGAAALPVVLGLAGFAVGITGPSRDMIVRASTPRGSTGKVYGFVYSGLDVGSLAMPVVYGWMMDHALPEGVFYTVAGLLAAAILTVMQLPGRAAAPATQRT